MASLGGWKGSRLGSREGLRVSVLGIIGIRRLQGELPDIDGTPYQGRGICEYLHLWIGARYVLALFVY